MSNRTNRTRSRVRTNAKTKARQLRDHNLKIRQMSPIVVAKPAALVNCLTSCHRAALAIPAAIPAAMSAHG